MKKQKRQHGVGRKRSYAYKEHGATGQEESVGVLLTLRRNKLVKLPLGNGRDGRNPVENAHTCDFCDGINSV